VHKNKSILFSFFHLGESELDEARNLRQDREKFLKFEKDRYFEFLNDDILQLNDALVHSVSSSKSTNLSLDSEGTLKILNLKISLIIFPRQSNGVMFFEYVQMNAKKSTTKKIISGLRLFSQPMLLTECFLQNFVPPIRLARHTKSPNDRIHRDRRL